MPIRPELRSPYPPHWRDLSIRIAISIASDRTAHGRHSAIYIQKVHAKVTIDDMWHRSKERDRGKAEAAPALFARIRRRRFAVTVADRERC